MRSEDVTQVAFDRQFEQSMRFEDMTQAELDAEYLADFPALAAPVVAKTDDGIDIPEATADLDVPDPASASIHDLLARLQSRTAAA